MLIARFIEVVVPLAGVGVVLLIAVRLARGWASSPTQDGWLHSPAMWRLLGRIFLGAGVYLFLTRFFR